jgi:hypothetical protein
MDPIVNLATASYGLASGAAGYVVLAAVEQPRWDTALAAVVGVGAVLVPAVVRWYRDLAAARRDEHVKDVETDSTLISAEVVKRVEAETRLRFMEAEIADLRSQLEKQRCPFSTGGHAMCDPAEPPGEWLRNKEETE